MTSSRVPYVAARQNQFPRFLSMIHVSFLTPVPAVILNGIVATLAVMQSNLNQLINYFSFAMWIFHTMTCLAVIVLRKLKERFLRWLSKKNHFWAHAHHVPYEGCKSWKADRSISENIYSTISCPSNNEYHWSLSRYGTIHQGKIEVFWSIKFKKLFVGIQKNWKRGWSFRLWLCFCIFVAIFRT